MKIGESRNGRRKYGKESKEVMEPSTVKKTRQGYYGMYI
jgi:hypothetical protein